MKRLAHLPCGQQSRESLAANLRLQRTALGAAAEAPGRWKGKEMESKRIFYGLLVVVLLAFVAGAGVSLYKRNFDSHYWSKDGIRGVRESCLQMEKSPQFCECYTQEIITRMSMKQFIEMTKNINKNEAVTAQAKQFVDSVISKCSDIK